MLSRPLPGHYPVPSALPAFVLHLLNAAVQKPSAGSLRPLYLTIKGAGSGILGILPLKKLMALQEQLVRLLRGLDDPSATLLCLAIFASLHTDLQSKAHSLSSQQSEPCITSAAAQARDICSAVGQFFGAKKALKTVDLVVLGAIRSCSSISNADPTQAVDSLSLVGEILDVVENNEKAIWVQKNSEKVQKLYQKAAAPNLNLEIRLAAFGVISLLEPTHSLPHDLLAIVEGLIQRTMINQSFDKVMQAYMGCFGRAFLLSQLSRVLDASIDRQRSVDATILELNGLKSFVRYLTEAAKSSSTIRQTLLVALSSNTIRDSLQSFLSNKSPGAKCIARHGPYGPYDQCAERADHGLRSLQRDVCKLLLISALFASSDEIGIDSALATHLLEMATAVPVLLNQYKELHIRPKTQLSTIPVYEDCPLPSLCRSDQDWRKSLREDLDRDTASRHELLIRSVSNICRDLEARCNNVEQPLVAEQQRSMKLQTQLESCEQKCIKLETKAKEHNVVIDGLQAERDTLICRLGLAELAAQKATEACATVQEELDMAHKEADGALRTSSEQLYQVELGNAATVAAKDALLEAEVLKGVSLEAQIHQLLDELSSARKEASIAQEQVSSALELEKSMHKGKEDLKQQTQVAGQALDQLESMKHEMDGLQLDMERRRIAEESSVRALQMTIDKIHRKYEDDTSAKDAELAQQKSCHERVVETLRTEINTTRTETARLIAQHELRIAELSHRVQQLNKELDMRAKEFAEAQDLSSKLMALMGKRPDDATPCATRISLSCDPELQVTLTPVSDQGSIRAAPLGPLGSNLSSAGDWYPKRPRDQHDMLNSSQHLEGLATGYESATSPHSGLMKPKRHVLKEIGCNAQNELMLTKSQQAHPEQETALKHNGRKGRKPLDFSPEVSYEAFLRDVTL